MRQLVAWARARLAELEVDFTKEKSRVDVVQAVLLRQLRGHSQKRDRLRLVVDLETFEKLTIAINRKGVGPGKRGKQIDLKVGVADDG